MQFGAGDVAMTTASDAIGGAVVQKLRIGLGAHKIPLVVCGSLPASDAFEVPIACRQAPTAGKLPQRAAIIWSLAGKACEG